MSGNKPHPQLAKGQIWKTGRTYLHIVERGKRLIQYTVTRDAGQRAVRTHLSGIGEVETYLKVNQAKLLKGAARGNGK